MKIIQEDAQNLTKMIKKICKFSLFPFIVVVLCFTIIFRRADYPQTITPLFYELKLIILKHSFWAIIDIVRNLFMLMPLGFILPVIYKRCHKMYSVALLAFLLSLFIEGMQLVTARGTCQMDDLMNNTIGAVIGFFIWKSAVKCFNMK